MDTDHCIKASVVSTLDESGFESYHIMYVTLHKSEESLKSYGSRCPDSKRKVMFNRLSNKILRMNCDTQENLCPEEENTMMNIKYSPVKEGSFDCGMRGDTSASIPGLTAGMYPINPALKGFKP